MRILFLGHEASRTGAPLLLLEIIGWLKQHTAVNPAIILLRGGELTKRYQHFGPTTILNNNLIKKFIHKLGLFRIIKPSLLSRYPALQYPIVYANTVATASLLKHFAGQGRILIHHVHELGGVTDRLNAVGLMKNSVEFIDLYIAASNAVKEYMCVSLGIPGERIVVIHEFAINLIENAIIKSSRNTIRKQLGLNDEDILVMMCGTPEYRKGADIFVQMAALANTKMKYKRLHFLWLGGNLKNHQLYRNQAKVLGANSICSFQSSVERPQDWLAAADIFTLTSREDPFSVVMLEAAAMGLPILCFAGAGGAPELVEDNAGIVVPFLDVEALTNACLELANDTSLRLQMGKAAQEKVYSQYRLDLKASKIYNELQRLTKAANAT
jgi:glycosyltransferase involved in cell wall biosynthesis